MPRWMLRPVRCGVEVARVEGILSEEGLNTVCVGAKCPNRGECYESGTATFMVMGAVCSRGCAFCAVTGGEVEPLRHDEPEAVARAAERMGLDHVVITSVTRDDLPDGGAGHFARTVLAVREALPGATVEVLVPDFLGDEAAVDTVLAASPDVFNHNVETVRGLYPRVRPQADYARSLEVLARAARRGARTKSGFMVGLGETRPELEELLRDLADAGCAMVTAGQYLRPTGENLPVDRYYAPDEFAELDQYASGLGLRSASGPLVRSSYRAADML